MLFLKVLARDASKKRKCLFAFINHFLQKFRSIIIGCDLFCSLHILADNISIFKESASKCNPLFFFKLLYLITEFHKKQPVAQLAF